MSEFKLHILASELLGALGSNDKPEEWLEYLQKNMVVDTKNASYMSTCHINNLAEGRNNPKALISKYEDLKQKNVDALEPYVELLQQISQDPSLKDFLQRTVKQSTSCQIDAIITKDNLSQVKHKLKSAATTKSLNSRLESSRLLNRSGHPLPSSSLNRSGPPLPSTPSLMSWVQRRPSMSWDFSSRSTLNMSGPLVNIPVPSQENILIEDLLNILIGLPSNYVEPQDLKDEYDPREFVINDQLDPSLRELVKRILPLASHYSIVQRFTEEKMRFEYGQVNNALAECMYKKIVDYMLFITQLESEFRSGNLNLHKMWYYVQKNMYSMGIISTIATTINKSDSRGGKVLSLLHDKIAGYTGDSMTQDLCVHLMQAASVPYMKMLSMWIYKGIISDPIHEFLIEDNELVQKEELPVDYSADYWDKKYMIRRERIPKFLEGVADIILRAGKYLNVIRQCGKVLNKKVQIIEYKKEERHYIEVIQEAYKYASQTLLDLVMREQDLLGRLRSVKHYFLLDQGDFIVTFLSLCEKELIKDAADVVQARLDSLLDLALRLSSADKDVYKEDLRTELLPYDLQFQMFKILKIQTNENQNYSAQNIPKSLSVIKSFSFSYEVRWPLSLILNRKSLARYQMIFRHLFYCKHVERMLCQVWKANKVAKKFPLQVARQYRHAFALRQRMLHCVQNLEYHMMVEVIEPHWCIFVQNMSKVTNVDEVLSCHTDFLDMCMKDCMLMVPELLAIITKLLSICTDFCKFIQRTQRYYVEAELGSLPNSFYESFTQGETATLEADEMPQNGSFVDNIERFDAEFTAALMSLLGQINDLNRITLDHDRLFNLLYRMAPLFSQNTLTQLGILLQYL